MIEIIHSAIIGVVQGITEFLPISSSAHLVIIPYVFKWDYKGLGFDVALHLGTVLAIVAYFYKDWVTIIKNVYPTKSKTKSKNYPDNFLIQIIVATIPAIIVGLLIKDYIESKFHSPLFLAFNLILFGIILWLSDRTSRKLEISKINYGQSFLVGLAQSISLVPGVSRSGITMIASRGIGLDRENAARLSFLLGTPAMIGAFLLESKNISANYLNVPFFVGVIVSATAGFLVIKYLLQYLKRGSFAVFTWYRIILALIVIFIYLIR
jgi:undecaprenyl-diphosphatase